MTHEKTSAGDSGPNLQSNFGWLRASIAIAAVGYTLVVAVRCAILADFSVTELMESAAALACITAFLTFRRWPRASGLTVVGAIWCELTYTLYAAGAPEVTSTLVYPALILVLGLILSERWAIAGAVVTGIAIPLAIFGGRQVQGITSNSAGVVTSVVMVEIILICAGLFARVIMKAFRGLLAESERLRWRYTRLFQDMPDGLLEIDPAGRIVESNLAVEKIFESNGEALTGLSLAEVLRRLKFGPDIVLSDIRPGLPVLLQAGDKRLEVTATTSQDAAGSALLVIRDVSVRHQMMEKQAMVQRLETVGHLAGGIAHEFNNLLTAIGGNAGLLKVHPDGDVQRFANQIMIAQQRAATMTRQMMAFARHDFHQAEVVSLGRELEEWAELLRHIAGEHCRLEIVGEGAGWVEVDQVQIEQVLVNLINNARDASAAGGLLEIRLGRLTRAEAQRLGSALDAGWQVTLEVVDRGHGMTDEVKSRLFEPFFTTKPQGQGIGLGLAAVHGLVAQNGGSIQFESEVGRGTTARIFFPEVAAGSRPASRNPVAAAGAPRRHVLLVDDDATACRTAVFALEQGGFEVTVVNNGFEAVKLFRLSAVEIHLVIASAVLPVLSGRDLAERLRKLHPDLPVLYVCSRFDLPPGWPVDDANSPLLMKPFRAEDLLSKVGSLLPARKP